MGEDQPRNRADDAATAEGHRMDDDAVWATIHAERAALADLLETLTAAQWATPSLCRGWTVREVAAHVIASAQVRMGPALVGMVRARGNFDRFIHDSGVRAGRQPTDRIVADFRRLADSRRHPPGTKPLDPLLDVLVHTQDIAVPLDRSHPMPVAAARTVAEYCWGKGVPFKAGTRLRGLSFAATDTDLVMGDGVRVEGPVGAILLALTGRAAWLDRFSGPGTAELAERLRR